MATIHKFKPAEFAAKQQAKTDQKAAKQGNATPTKLPDLVDRVKLIEAVLGL